MKRLFAAILMVAISAQVAVAGDTNVFRLYNSHTGDHFYTTNFDEKTNNSCHRFLGYLFEGAAFRVYDSSSGGHQPVYRLFNPHNKHHFYTISAGERDFAISQGFSLEGIAFYAHTTQQGGDVPVYRLYAEVRGDHFYTTSASERDAVLNDPHAAIPYEDEGIAFYTNPNAPVTIYRLIKWGTSSSSGFDIWDHLYTGANEVDNLPCDEPRTYRYEGLAFSAYGSDTGGLLAIRRFFKPSTGHHFYTASSQEAGYALDSGYNDEGTAFYTSPGAANVVDRFRHLSRGYIYLPPGEEHDYLMGLQPQWQRETSAFNADGLCTGNGCNNLP